MSGLRIDLLEVQPLRLSRHCGGTAAGMPRVQRKMRIHQRHVLSSRMRRAGAGGSPLVTPRLEAFIKKGGCYENISCVSD